jgi:hypothetical protein
MPAIKPAAPVTSPATIHGVGGPRPPQSGDGHHDDIVALVNDGLHASGHLAIQ